MQYLALRQCSPLKIEPSEPPAVAHRPALAGGIRRYWSVRQATLQLQESIEPCYSSADDSTPCSARAECSINRLHQQTGPREYGAKTRKYRSIIRLKSCAHDANVFVCALGHVPLCAAQLSMYDKKYIVIIMIFLIVPSHASLRLIWAEWQSKMFYTFTFDVGSQLAVSEIKWLISGSVSFNNLYCTPTFYFSHGMKIIACNVWQKGTPS